MDIVGDWPDDHSISRDDAELVADIVESIIAEWQPSEHPSQEGEPKPGPRRPELSLAEIALADHDIFADSAFLGSITSEHLRLYLIDEPERNLHLRAQRTAAEWLDEDFSRRGAQALLASHSVPFLSLGASARYVEVALSDSVTLRPFGPAELDATSLLASELGLTRGELLGLRSAFLFVEGRVDQRVLSELYPALDKELGVAIVPIHSASSAPAIIDTELIGRFTTMPIALLIDGDAEQLVRRLQSEADALNEVLNTKKLEGKPVPAEVRSAAALLRSCNVHERRLAIFSLKVPDVFFALDEDVAAEVCAQSPERERYPGHAEFERRYLAHRADEGKSTRKDLLRKHHGISVDEMTCGAIAAAMRQRGAFPDDLQQVVDGMRALIASSR